MPGLLDLLTQQPQAKPAAPQKAPATGLARLAEAIESSGDEYTQEVLRSMIEGRIGFRIPSRAEVDLENSSRALRQEQIITSRALANVDLAQVAFLDMDPALKKKYGLQDDFLSNPVDTLLTVINKEGLSPEPLTKGQLGLALSKTFNVPIGDPQRILDSQAEQAAAQEQEAAMKAEQTALTQQRQAREDTLAQARFPSQAAEADTKAAEVTQQYAEGEGIYGQQAEERKGNIEEAYGVDLTSSFFGPDADWDTPKGAAAGMDLIDTELNEVGPRIGKPAAAAALLAKHGKDIASQLTGLPEKDGLMVVGQGDGGVDDEATFYLAATVAKLAMASGKREGDILQNVMGLPYKGIDAESFAAFAQMIAQREGVDPQTFLREALYGRQQAAP